MKLALITLNQVKAVSAQVDEATGEVIAEAHETQVATAVNPLAIRCFYPRNEDKPGSRITFTDGGGFAVSETVEQITSAIAEA